MVSIRVATSGLVILFLAASGDHAVADSDSEALAAGRELQRAEITYRLYRHVDYPRTRRRLDAQITLVEKRVEHLQARVREYRQFDRNRYSRPLLISLQNAEIELLEAELALAEIEAQQRAAVRFHADRCRLYELEIEAAQARLAMLEPGS